MERIKTFLFSFVFSPDSVVYDPVKTRFLESEAKAE